MNNLLLPSHRAMIVVVWLTVTLACAIPGFNRNQPSAPDTLPVITISSPTSGQEIEPGTEIEIMSTAIDVEGIVRTELLVDGQVIWVDGGQDGQMPVGLTFLRPAACQQ